MKTTGLPQIPSRMTKKDVHFCLHSHESSNPANSPIEGGSAQHLTIDDHIPIKDEIFHFLIHRKDAKDAKKN